MDLRHRSLEPEILDDPAVPETVREECYRDLARTHKWLGNTRAIIQKLRCDPLPVRKVIDIGCAHGAMLEEIRQQLGVEVVGVDLMPPARRLAVPILRRDAIHEELPQADVAISVAMAHHLSPEELQAMICNVGRSCRRFLILDLVRHPLPLALFRVFVAPLVNRINVDDGIRSLERAFTPRELSQIVAGTGLPFRQEVATFKVRQIVDIEWKC